MKFNYEGRIFRGIANSANGETGNETRFHYHQQEDVVWAAYGGGQILLGSLLAKMNPDDGSLDMRYHHLNRRGEFMTGECHSRLEVLPDGRYRLHEKWRWTSGDSSSGESVVEELPSSSSATPSA